MTPKVFITNSMTFDMPKMWLLAKPLKIVIAKVLVGFFGDPFKKLKAKYHVCLSHLISTDLTHCAQPQSSRESFSFMLSNYSPFYYLTR
jgi:hypothetical protein